MSDDAMDPAKSTLPPEWPPCYGTADGRFATTFRFEMTRDLTSVELSDLERDTTHTIQSGLLTWNAQFGSCFPENYIFVRWKPIGERTYSVTLDLYEPMLDSPFPAVLGLFFQGMGVRCRDIHRIEGYESLRWSLYFPRAHRMRNGKYPS